MRFTVLNFLSIIYHTSWKIGEFYGYVFDEAKLYEENKHVLDKSQLINYSDKQRKESCHL